MVKWIGYLLILASCWALGEQAVNRLKERRNALRRLRAWLSCFRGKIVYENAAMEEALEESADLAGQVFSPFFYAVARELGRRSGRSLRQIWESESEAHRRRFLLGEEEFGELRQLGSQLGELDRDVQERTIRRYEESLAASLVRVEEELKQKEKLYRSLGVLAGCFIIILIC